MEPLYKSHLSRVRTLLQRWPDRSADYYYHAYRVDESAYQTSQSDLHRFKATNIDEILSQLDTFYILEKLRYYCEALSRKTFTPHQYKNHLIPDILALVEQGVFDHVPSISIYYQIVQTHLDPNEEKHYFTLKEALQSFGHQLAPSHMKSAYYAALNYCNRKINQGKLHFLSESFQMYVEVIDKALIYNEQHQMSHWTYKNVVVLALRLGEFDWASHFVEHYQGRIPEAFRKNAVTYNLAQIQFYQKDYEEVLSLLQEVEYEDVTYNLGAKTMLLATYYELGEWEALQALGDSFRVFIHRRKSTLTDARRNSYLNLIKFTLKLANIDHHSAAFTRLLEQLNASKVIASEKWIREKVQEKEDNFSSNRLPRNQSK